MDVSYEPGCLIERSLPVLDARHLTSSTGAPAGEPVTVEYFDNLDLEGEPFQVESASAMHFAWNGPPVPGLEVGKYSVRLAARVVPERSGLGQVGILGVGRMRLLIDGGVVVDNWDEPVIAPILFGRGDGQLIAEVELLAGVAVLVEVELQAPEPELSRRALELSAVPPTERDNDASAPSGVTVGYRDPLPKDLIGRAEGLAARSDAVVVVVGTNEDRESEGFDRDSLALPPGQDELIFRVARANSNVVVVLNTGSAVAMPWAPDVAAVVQLWLPGQEAGNALADVLFGDINPSGRLPVTVPVRLEDSGAAAGYPPVDGQLVYGEGVRVGYRNFDASGVEPRFCFGHGLSYTTFSYGPLSVDAGEDGDLRAEVVVSNTGQRAGTEVVQLYLGDVGTRLHLPPRVLKGIAKLHLGVGEQARASFLLPRAAFAHFDVARRDWVVAAGQRELSVGASSRDIRSRASISVNGGAALSEGVA